MEITSYFKCERPVSIVNRYTHRRQIVPCGKCPSCLMKKNARKVQFYEMEASKFRFTVFFTLTYDDSHLPLSDIPDHCDLSLGDSMVLESYGNMIPYFDSRDFQLFIKNIRYELFKNGVAENLHYFFATEFGPSTFRPHGHGLFFTDSDWFADNCSRVISEAWCVKDSDSPKSRGFVDVQLAGKKSVAYVVQYCNGVTDLPPVFREKPFKCRTFSSRTSKTGSFAVSYSQVYQILFADRPEFFVLSFFKDSSKPVVLWRNFKDRWFPKCRGFNTESFGNLFFLYRLSRFFGKVENFQEFKSVVELYLDKYPSFYVSRQIIRFFCDEYSAKFNDVPLLLVNRLKNGYYLSRRFFANCEYLNIKPALYQYLIERYYSLEELHYISDFWQTFENDVLKYPDKVTMLLRSSFLLRFPLYEDELELHLRLYYLKQFAYDVDDLSVLASQIIEATDFLKSLSLPLFSKYHEILRNTKKNKGRNDYLFNESNNF